jgi:hypothetical protein
MNTRLLGHARVVACLALAAIPCASCAYPAEAKAMVPTEFAVTNRHAASACVQVNGGKETDPMWRSNISGPAYAEALAMAITQSGVFAAVVGSAAADCRLVVDLIKVVDDGSFELEVTVVAQWRLFDLATGGKLSDQAVVTTFLATLGDAFVGATRKRIANEGAARMNIKEGLRQLSELAPIPAGGKR